VTSLGDHLDLLQLLGAGDREGGARLLAAQGSLLDGIQEAIAAVGTVAMQDVPCAVRGGRIVAAIADMHGDPMLRAQARRALSRALAWGSEYEQALCMADEAARMASQAGLDEEEGRARLASMHALTEMGRLEDAAAAGMAARETFEHMGSKPMAARADINLGVVYQHLDQPDRAVACLTRAREPLAGEDAVLGHLENNLGESLLAMDDIAGAEVAFLDARSAFEKAGADLTAAIAEGNLADLAARRGRLGTSLQWFEQARRRLAPVDAPGHLARLLSERAEVLASVGMATEACAAFEDVLPRLDEAGLRVEAARARRGLGRAALLIGDVSRASTMLAAAATAYGDLGQQIAQAEVDLDRARVAAKRKHLDETFRLAHAAMARLRGRPLREVECRLVLAEAYLDSDPQQAECELDAAEIGARRLDVPPLLARTMHLKGRLRKSQGRMALASAALSEATEQVERLRGSVQADRCRAGLGLSHRAVYEDHFDVLLSQSSDEAAQRAFMVADRMRSRVLLDQVRRGDLARDLPAAAEHAEHEILRDRLSLLYSRLADAMDGESLDVRAWREDLRQAEAILAESEISQSSAGRFASIEQTRLDVSELQSSLSDGEVLVQYSVLDGEVMAFVASADDLVLVRGLGTIDRIAERLEALRFQIARAVGHRGTSHRRLDRMVHETQLLLRGLHNEVATGLPDVVCEAKRLIIVPQGLLHLVPFHALHDGVSYRIEQHDVHYVPSASLLLHLRNRCSERASGPNVVVAGADAGLPGVRREAERAAALLGANTRLLSGESSNVAAVRQELANAGTIHITGHGTFMPTHVGASGIRLHDGWLSLHEIHGLHLCADLVVLSSCESGPIRGSRGDEPTGLFHGFLSAGAGGLLASLWRVSDATSRFMLESFHDHVQNQGCDFTSALRAAQLEAMEARPHPAHWAPFIFAGVNP